MRVAIVGTGIAGLSAAHRLSAHHDLTIFEARDRLGGHTHTVDVTLPEGRVAVDTGFIVFNTRTYPLFMELLHDLGVESQPSDMSFSVRSERTGMEYNGDGLRGMLARPSNGLRPGFWRMLKDILRFYRESPALLSSEDPGPSLGQYLEQGNYSRAFLEDHLMPMASAVWSSKPEDVLRMPAKFLVRFFDHHGFLQLEDRPQWLTVKGGSRSYVRALVKPLQSRMRLATPIERVSRVPGGVDVQPRNGASERFDRVLLACHSDQALGMLADPTPSERQVLGAIPYQKNSVVLHTDSTVMPRTKRAWASWNYHLADPASSLPTVTYWMNRLQDLELDTQLFVTLNRDADIDPAKVLGRFSYSHPIFGPEAVAAQARHAEIDGTGGVHYAGAYWANGFHEDGVRSTLPVLEALSQGVLV